MPPETEKKLNPLEQTIATQAGQETPAQTLARSRNIAKPTGVEAITPTELQPTAVIDVPTPAIATQGQAMAGDIAEQTDAFTRQQEAASTAAEGTKNTALENYLAGLQSSQSVASLTDQEYSKEGGVDSITPELNDINDKIRREQLALRRASEAQTGQGQSKAQTQAAINNLERDSFQKQADLSIIQLATQGRYDSAVSQADRAVQAKFEQQKIYNDTLQFAYSEAKDIFTQAEQREFETLLGNRNRALDTAKENANEIYRIGIEAQREGAPTDVVERMLSAKTKEEAANIGGSYIGALDREAKRASIAASNAGIAQGWARVNLAERQFAYEQQADAVAQEISALEAAGELTEEQAQNQTKVESALRLQDLTQQIRGHAGFNLSVGSLGSRVVNVTEGGLAGQLFNALSGQGEGFDALYDQLTESLTLDNLDKMSGVLTDRDIQVLRSAATRLRKTTTETEFLNTLDEMDSIFQRTIDENGITPQQASFYYGVGQEDLNEIDEIFGTNTSTVNTTSFDF